MSKVVAVRMLPGDTTFIRQPAGPYSVATVFAKLASPALAAPYTAWPMAPGSRGDSGERGN